MAVEFESALTLSIETLKRAVAADVEHNYEEAFFLYGDGIAEMRAAGETVKDEPVFEKIAKKIEEYEGRKARLEKFLRQQSESHHTNNGQEQMGMRRRSVMR